MFIIHPRILNNTTNEYDLIYTFPSESTSCSFVNMNFGLVVSNGKDDLIYYKRSRSKNLTGTISITSGTNTVTGSGTLFNEEISKCCRSSFVLLCSICLSIVH